MRKSNFPFILLLLLVVENELRSQWVSTGGPELGAVNTILANSQNLFMGGYQGVFSTPKNSIQWQSTGTGLPVSGIKCLGRVNTDILAGTGLYGVYKSSDNGATWVSSNAGLTDGTVASILFVSGIVYIGTSNGVFFSTDDGDSWTILNNGIENYYVTELLSVNNEIFAGTQLNGIFKFNTNTNVWEPKNNGLSNIKITGLAHQNGDLVACTDGGGVFKSTNAGESWFSITNNLPITYLMSLSANDDIMFVGASGGLYKTLDGGNNWVSAYNGLQNRTIEKIVITNDTLYCGTHGFGIYRSFDEGENWTSINSGLHACESTVVRSGGGNLYCGSFFSGLSKYSNNSWTRFDNLWDYIADINITNGDVYVAVSGGANKTVYKSDNNGGSWTDLIMGGFPVSSISSIEKNGQNIFVGDNNMGVYYSNDEGNSWSARNNGIVQAMNPKVSVNGQSAYCGTTDGLLYKSSDLGLNWVLVFTATYSGPYKEILFFNDHVFAMSSELYVSSDNGNSWSINDNNGGFGQTQCIHRIDSTLFVGTYLNGIFKSDDLGVNWVSISENLPAASINSITHDADYLYIGTWGQGVWKRPLTDLITCNTISIANEPQDLALSENESGIFMCLAIGSDINYQWQSSSDGGTSWSNLTDGIEYTGVNTHTLNILSAQLPMNGNKYRCTLTNLCTPLQYSQMATVTVSSTCVPISSNYIVEDRFVTEPTPVAFGVSSSGTSIQYDWEYSQDGGNNYLLIPNASPFSGQGTSSITIFPSSVSMNGYKIRCKMSNPCTPVTTTSIGTLYVNTNCVPVMISGQPQNLNVQEGEQGLFLVQATGTQPISVQWYKNDQLIPGATNFQYEIPAALLSDDGAIFKAILTNCAGTLQSNGAVLNVTNNCVHVSILSGPNSVTAPAGSTVNFQVTAQGTPPIEYQWFHNNIPINGQFTPTLTLSNISQANGGDYYCTVFNCDFAGQDESPFATLTVSSNCNPVGIQTHPQNKQGQVGSTTTFSVTASGTPPFSYQWRKNNQDIPGANTAEYTTPVLNISDNGAVYRCFVSNCAGSNSIVSSEAILTVVQNCNTPSIQASNILSSNIQPNQITLAWTKGNGNKTILVAKKNGPVVGTPTNGINYLANSAFGLGNTIAQSEYVVYNGAANSVTVTNLEPNTNYHFRAFEYDCSPTKYQVANSAGNPLQKSTAASLPKIDQFVGTCVVPDHGLNYSFFDWPDYGSTALKVCADGSNVSYFKVKVDNADGVSFRIKHGTTVVSNPNFSQDEAKYGKLYSPYTFTTNFGTFVEVNYLHPDHVSSGLFLPLKLEVTHNNAVVKEFDLHIYRAPVLFVHGFMGDDETFLKMENKFFSEHLYPRALMNRVDYHPTSFERFYVNRHVLPQGIYQLFLKTKSNNYSAAKVIAVAHSMGGILSRLYLQNKVIVDQFRYKNDFQKLITLNTPHYGTQFANWSNKFIDKFTDNHKLIKKFIEYKYPNLLPFSDRGAILDMTVDSEAINNLLNKSLNHQNKVPSTTISSIHSLTHENEIGLLINDIIYNGDKSDLIVPLESQQGGILTNPPINDQFHVGSAENSQIIDLVKNYINLSTNSQLFTKTGFPNKTLHFNYYKFSENPKNKQIPFDDIVIDNPIKNTLVKRNELISIRLANADQYDRIGILIYSPPNESLIIDTNSIDSLSYLIPANAFGEMKIWVLAGDSIDWVSTDLISIHINDTILMDSLKVFRDTIHIPLGVMTSIDVFGYFEGNPEPVSVIGYPGLRVAYDSTALNIDRNVVGGNQIGSSQIVFTYFGLSDTLIVEVENDSSFLVAAFDYSTEKVCQDGVIQFSDRSRGLPISYKWTFEGGVPDSSTEKDPQVHYAVPGKYAVQLKTTFVNGVDSFLIDSFITVLAKPYIELEHDLPLSFCEGDQTVLWVQSSANEIEWSNFETSDSILVTTSGLYFAYALDSNGCYSISDSLYVEVFDLPENTISFEHSEVCHGEFSILNSETFESYLWSTGDTIRSITVSEAGDYFVGVIDSNGCMGYSDTFSLVVHNLPLNDLHADKTAFCEGDSVVLTSQSFDSYIWNTGDTTQSIIIRDHGAYFVSVIDSNGCSSVSDTFLVTENSLPEVVLETDGPASFCYGDSVEVAAYSSDSLIAYQWNTGQISKSIVLGESRDVSVMVTDINGCMNNSETITIEVFPLPIAEIINKENLEICQGDSLVLKGREAVVYEWSTGESQSSIVVRDSGWYQLAVLDDNGCRSLPDSVYVSVLSLPQVMITSDGSSEFCSGDSLILSAIVDDHVVEFIWNTGENSQDILVDSSGYYYVHVVDVNGCRNESEELSITVFNLPDAQITPSGPTTFCEGDSVTLIAGTFLIYQWSSGQITDSIIINYNGDFRVTVTDQNGCTGISEITSVVVNPLPNVRIEGESKICEDQKVVLEAFGADQYLWNNGSNSNQIGENHGPGSYVYEVSGTDTLGCVGSAFFEVIVNALPDAQIYHLDSLVFCKGDSILLQALGGIFYQWSTGESSESISVSSTQNLYVKVTDINGCSATSDTLKTFVLERVEPLIDILPEQFAGCEGDTLVFQSNIVHGGYNPVINWYVNDNLKVENTATLSISSLKHGDQIYCELISNEYCLVKNRALSGNIIVAINSKVTPTVEISTNTQEIIACDPVIFHSTYDHAGTNPVFKWYIDDVFEFEGPIFETTTLKNGDRVACTMKSSLICVTEHIVSSGELIMSVSPLVLPEIELYGDSILCSNCEEAGFEYQWFFNGIEVSNEPIISCLDFGDGEYFLVITKNGCLSISTIILVQCVVNTLEENAFNNVTFHPNPTTGKFELKAGANFQSFDLIITDNLGRLVLKKTYNESIVDDVIDLSSEKSGMYFIELRDKSSIYTTRIIKL